MYDCCPANATGVGWMRFAGVKTNPLDFSFASSTFAPHDSRRTCARLSHLAGGELEQIQFLLDLVLARPASDQLRFFVYRSVGNVAIQNRWEIVPHAGDS